MPLDHDSVPSSQPPVHRPQPRCRSRFALSGPPVLPVRSAGTRQQMLPAELNRGCQDPRAQLSMGISFSLKHVPGTSFSPRCEQGQLLPQPCYFLKKQSVPFWLLEGCIYHRYISNGPTIYFISIKLHSYVVSIRRFQMRSKIMHPTITHPSPF